MAIKEPAAGVYETAIPAAMQNGPLDMAALLTAAYELGDMIIHSADAADYEYWKNAVRKDEQVRQLVKQFERAKEKFEECQRFGRFHPDYHAAKDEVKALERQLDEIPAVRSYKTAEQAVDKLLYEIAAMIAGAVSDDIKVPANDARPAGGCGSGGSCGCGSGGCG